MGLVPEGERERGRREGERGRLKMTKIVRERREREEMKREGEGGRGREREGERRREGELNHNLLPYPQTHNNFITYILNISYITPVFAHTFNVYDHLIEILMVISIPLMHKEDH